METGTMDEPKVGKSTKAKLHPKFGRLPKGVWDKPGAPVWWIRYATGKNDPVTGKPLMAAEPTEYPKDDKKKHLDAAQALVVERRSRVKKGEVPVRTVESFTFDAMMAEYLRVYRTTKRKSASRAQQHVKHLTEFFGGWKVKNIDEAAIRAYIEKRQADRIITRKTGEAGRPVADATINRELCALRRGFRIAHRQVARIPVFSEKEGTFLKEDNARKGFFEEAQLQAVLKHLPDYMQLPVRFMHVTGWRVNSEVLTRQWKHVDFRDGWVTLEPGRETKNGTGRHFRMTKRLRAVLMEARERVERLQKAHGKVIPWVFPTDDGEQWTKWHYGTWNTACEKAGTPGRLAHDFRRTAVRNLIRAGVSRSVAMKMTGHKTETVFERYNIVDENDLEEAADKLDAFADRQAESPKVVSLKMEKQ